MSNNTLTISTKGLQLLSDIETLQLLPYDDQTSQTINHWVPGATIGCGHLILEKDWWMYQDGISYEQATALFREDLQPVESIIKQIITVPLQQHQFDALCLLAFNIGINGLSISSVVKLINNPQAKTLYPTLSKAWGAWARSRGELVQGLINRRTCEYRLYERGIYEHW